MQYPPTPPSVPALAVDQAGRWREEDQRGARIVIAIVPTPSRAWNSQSPARLPRTALVGAHRSLCGDGHPIGDAHAVGSRATRTMTGFIASHIDVSSGAWTWAIRRRPVDTACDQRPIAPLVAIPQCVRDIGC
jgi:hypothetical protein